MPIEPLSVDSPCSNVDSDDTDSSKSTTTIELNIQDLGSMFASLEPGIPITEVSLFHSL